MNRVLLLLLVIVSSALADQRDSVVRVSPPGHSGAGGTGFVIKSHRVRVIVTNAHVCEDAKENMMQVQTRDGVRRLKRIIRHNVLTDLCLLDGVSEPALELSRKNPLPNEKIYQIGFPLLGAVSVATGHFKKFLHDLLPVTAGDTDVETYPGNSGSPVFNKDGEVVGVMSVTDTQTYQGMFVPLTYLKEILSD